MRLAFLWNLSPSVNMKQVGEMKQTLFYQTITREHGQFFEALDLAKLFERLYCRRGTNDIDKG